MEGINGALNQNVVLNSLPCLRDKIHLGAIRLIHLTVDKGKGQKPGWVKCESMVSNTMTAAAATTQTLFKSWIGFQGRKRPAKKLKAGSRNANVLPLPVAAMPITSCMAGDMRGIERTEKDTSLRIWT